MARPLVRARTRLDHYVQLVNAELYVMINAEPPRRVVPRCAG